MAHALLWCVVSTKLQAVLFLNIVLVQENLVYWNPISAEKCYVVKLLQMNGGKPNLPWSTCISTSGHTSTDCLIGLLAFYHIILLVMCTQSIEININLWWLPLSGKWFSLKLFALKMLETFAIYAALAFDIKTKRSCLCSWYFISQLVLEKSGCIL